MDKKVERLDKKSKRFWLFVASYSITCAIITGALDWITYSTCFQANAKIECLTQSSSQKTIRGTIIGLGVGAGMAFVKAQRLRDKNY